MIKERTRRNEADKKRKWAATEKEEADNVRAHKRERQIKKSSATNRQCSGTR